MQAMQNCLTICRVCLLDALSTELSKDARVTAVTINDFPFMFHLMQLVSCSEALISEICKFKLLDGVLVL